MKSMRWQLISRFLILFAILLGIMEITQYLMMSQYFYRSKEQLLESRYHIVEPAIADKAVSERAVRDLSKYLVIHTVDRNISAAIIDKSGNVISESSSLDNDGAASHEASEGETAVSSPHLPPAEYIRLLNLRGDLEGNRVITDPAGNRIELIWRKLGSNGSYYGLIQLATSVESVRETLANQLYIYLAASILILLLGGILSKELLKYTLKPLKNMTSTLKEITVGRLDRQLPEDNGQDEVDELSAAFNEMLGRIKVSFEKEQALKVKMRQFVSDASHELRTPLTSIHGFVEVLLLGAAKNEAQLNKALGSILMESERLTKLVNDLLQITRLDQQVPAEMAEESLDTVIEEVYPQLEVISGERKLKLLLEKNIRVLANRNQIKQVIFNLAHNAILHTDQKEGEIIISLGLEMIDNETCAVLKVADNGTGIPEKDLNDIFDRFFRSDAHRSRKQGGYGLGLSIVKSIVDAHQGKITVESEMLKGTVFTVFLKPY